MSGSGSMNRSARSAVIEHVLSATEIFYKIVAEKLGMLAQEYLRFPRQIEDLVSFSFALPIISLPQLSLHSKAEYLCILRGDPELPPQNTANRELLGLLHVGPPANVIFIKQGLSPQVRNYVIAHELGHYLYDIFITRRLWLNSLPEQAEVIMQAFSWQEVNPWLELYAMLKGLPQRPRTITGRGQNILYATKARELFADTIARELLAPWEQVSELFMQHTRSEVLTHLCEHYGVPVRIAQAYYDELRHTLIPPQDLFDRLFAPVLRKQRFTNSVEE